VATAVQQLPAPTEEDQAALQAARCGRARCLLGLARPGEAAVEYRQVLAAGMLPAAEAGAMARAMAESGAEDDAAWAAYAVTLAERRGKEGRDPIVTLVHTAMDRLVGDEASEEWWSALRRAVQLKATAPDNASALSALGYVCGRWGALDQARTHHQAAVKSGAGPELKVFQALAEMVK
jgi:Flp pilus assembly protein TadD